MRRFLVPPALRKGANPYRYTASDMGENLAHVGKESVKGSKDFLKKNFNPKEPVFMKDPEGRNMNNLWTGYGYGGKGRIMATASLLGGGAIYATRDVKTPAESEMLDVESLQSTRGDGIGYQAQIGNLADMSASGDLVFAMHRTRHSGQM